MSDDLKCLSTIIDDKPLMVFEHQWEDSHGGFWMSVRSPYSILWVLRDFDRRNVFQSNVANKRAGFER